MFKFSIVKIIIVEVCLIEAVSKQPLLGIVRNTKIGVFMEPFSEITTSDWWKSSIEKFTETIKFSEQRHTLILYNADVDGFVASYFIYKLIILLTKPNDRKILTKAVWNYEFDFAWLSKYVESRNVDNIICLDIPIIQELVILNKIARKHKIAIYDHHIVQNRYSTEFENILYINSRLLDTNRINHPTSAFAAAFAHESSQLSMSEYILAAIGLFGDHALYHYPSLIRMLQQKYSEFFDTSDIWNSKIGVYTSKLNSLFRAYPSQTPSKIHKDVHSLFHTNNPIDALDKLVSMYEIEKAQRLVQEDVKRAINEFKSIHIEKVLCEVVKMTTFSVGIVSTLISREKTDSIIALGFISGSRIQFELRTSDKNEFDLVQILTLQRQYFQPLTSGGHPKAAGALIKSKDLNDFQISFKKAFNELY